MKPRIDNTGRIRLPFAGALAGLLAAPVAMPPASGATLYWDGGNVDIAGNGNGASGGTAGTWNTSIKNWDAGAVPYVAWTNANNDTAVFGGTAGAVTLGVPIVAGGLTFSHTTGTYTLQTGALTLAAGSIVKATSGGGTASLATLASADSTFRFQNTVTTNNLANSTVFTVNAVPTALSGANANSVEILGNGASTAAPVVLGASGQTLAYTGTTTVADKAALGFNASALNIANGSITMGANSSLLRSGGNLNQATLDKIAATTNTFTIIGNNAGTASALNLTNFPNASLAFWDNAGTQTFGFTGAITAGSNGYLFGSTRAGNTINIGGTSGTGAVTNNILTGTAGLTFITGTIGTNPLNLWGSNTFSGNTTNNTSRAININNALALQNSAIDTSGAGTYALGTGSSGTGGNGGAAITTPTIGGLIGSKNLLTNVIATAGYNTMTSLTLNPGSGKDHTYSGVIANSTAGLSLTKSGAGTQVLSGLNTFAGNVTISGGVLAAGVAGNGTSSALGAVASTRTINVNTGGTLRFDSPNVFHPTFSTPAASLPVLNIAGGTMTNGGSATNSALGDITLAGGTLTATTGSPIGTGQSGEGWGSWNLNGTVTSTGTSTISSTAPGGIPITLSATATNGYITTVDVQSGTLTASAPFGNVTRIGNETVSGLAKIGAGTMILSGTNTYTGNTAVNTGTLTIASKDSLPGYNANDRFSVASGATLGVQNGVSESEIGEMLATSNFLSGANLGFDTTAGSRTVSSNLADTAQGPLGIVKLGANTLTLAGTNTYTGGTTVLAGSLYLGSTGSLPSWNVNGGFSVASGASLVIPNTVSESEVTTLLGTTNIAAGASLLFDTSLGDRTYLSAVTNSAQGLLNIGKIGSNALTLAGVNTYTGNTSVTDGTLNITGTLAGSTSSSNFTYGTAATTTKVNVSSGAVLTLAALQGANNTAAVSVYSQSGGTVTVGTPLSTAESAYAASSGYGCFNLSGGSVTVHSRFTAATNGAGGGKGVTRVGGGAGPATLAAGDLLAISRGSGAIGELTVLANGTVTFTGTGSVNMLIHGNNTLGTGFLNISGGTFSSPVKPVAFGNGTATNTSLGMINVGAGTLELGTGLLVNTIASGTNRGFVNFTGGTLKLLATTSGNLLLPASNGGYASLANTVFGKVTNSTANLDGTGAASAVGGIVGTTQDFVGGVTIDTGAFNTTISGPIVAPSGGGVAQGNINITDAGVGYSGPPTVVFSNPTAANATPAAGYALVSGGQLAGIVITSPGCYDSADTVTVTLTGGGATTPAAVASIAGSSLTANTSGGLTKSGTGTLTLSGANTYGGATAVNAGTLNLTGNLTSNITVANHANLSGEGSTTGSLTFSGTSDLGFDPSTAATYLAANSANATGASVSVIPTVPPSTATGIVVLDASGGITGTAGGPGNNFAYSGRGTLYFNVGNTQLLLDTTPASLAWRGNDGTNPTFWDLNTTTNWDSGTAEKYLTGDAVTFDETAASYIVDINAAHVFPGNVTFNNTTTYTLQGAYGINGGATLTKNGTGTTVMNTSNGYTGATTVTAGVLNIRNANALGSTTAGTTVTSGAALEIQGGITTAAEGLTLNGPGISNTGALRNISGNNTWGAAVALGSAATIGSDAGTLILPSLTGAFALTKAGAGTVNITGATAVTSTTVEDGTLYLGAQTGASTTTTLGAGNAVTLNGSGNLTIRRTNTGAVDLIGAISGTGSLTLLGDNATTSLSGDFQLNNASTYSGGTTITEARAAVSNSTALGTGMVTLGTNGQIFMSAASLSLPNDFVIGGLGWNETSGYLGALRLNGTTLSGNITLTADTRITGTNTSTLSGIISGGFGLDFFEDTVIGTISLSGANDYTGTTVVNSMGPGSSFPNLIVSNNNALGTTDAGTIVYGTGTTGNGSQITMADGITVTGETLTLDATSNGYRASLITAGTAAWDGNVVTAGTGGLVGFHANGASSSLTVGSSDTDTITGTNSLLLRGTGTGTVKSTINIGPGGVFKTDNGTWTITSNNNGFTGTPSIAAGIVSVGTIADSGVNCALGAGTTISFGQNSSTVGTLQFTGASGGSSNRALTIANGASGGNGVIENAVAGQTLTLSGALTTNAPASASALILTGAGDGVLSGGIVGTPLLTLNKSGDGSWTLSNAITYTGPTNLTVGTLTFNAGSVFNSATAVGIFTINGATAVANIAGTYNVGGGNGNAYFEIKGGGALNFNGNASLGDGTSGAGVRIGEGSAGTMTMTGGTFTANLNSSSNLVVGRSAGGNGTLNLSGGTLTVTGTGGIQIANTAGNTGVVTVSGTGAFVMSSTGVVTMGTGTSTINLNTGGTFTLGSAMNASTGTSTINFDGGTLMAGRSSTTFLPAALTAVNILDGGAIIDTNGFNDTIGNPLLADVVSTGGGLTKLGTGILTLTGANTYTGPTTVNAGTLLVNSPGSLAAGSAVSVNNTSTLGGSGTIGGSVTATAAANLSPGASAGTLTISGALDISALAGGAGTLVYELDTLAGTNDKIVAGTLAIGSGALGFNDFSFTNLGGLQAGTYKLITSGGVTGTLDSANLTGTIGSFNATLRLTGNDVELVVASAFSSWAASKGLDGTPGKENGKADDPDKDGKNNLAEFAFDGDPLSGANDGKIVGKVATVGGNQVLTLTLPVRTGATFSADSGDQLSALIDGIYYRIEGDESLSPFADTITEVPAGTELEAIQDGLPPLSPNGAWTYRTFRAPGTVPTVPKAFLRAKISETP